jgi:cytochrome c oxidase subunit 3
MSSSAAANDVYYVPQSSPYPALLSLALTLLFVGLGLFVNSVGFGEWIALAGLALVLYAIAGWIGSVIGENRRKSFKGWEDGSFRLGMIWFIVSEVVLFATFFSCLAYERLSSVPRLAGLDAAFTPWHGYAGGWPTAGPSGTAFGVVSPWGIPLLNTVLLLSSGVTVTWAHFGLLAGKRGQLKIGLALTILLGVIFLYFQAEEFHHAYTELGLTLGSGVYGATFFMLTGLHGFHVTLGVLMLTVMLVRSAQGDFTQKDHFAFSAVSWYWHFVDVVWLMLFVFVYWL